MTLLDTVVVLPWSQHMILARSYPIWANNISNQYNKYYAYLLLKEVHKDEKKYEQNWMKM